MDIPWERASLARVIPSMSLADLAFDETHGMKLAVTINPEHADKLLAGSGHTFAEILEAATPASRCPASPYRRSSRPTRRSKRATPSPTTSRPC